MDILDNTTVDQIALAETQLKNQFDAIDIFVTQWLKEHPEPPTAVASAHKS